ncbi:ABC transporter ATP-binding protein [Sporolactobacillus laevolacticus]|uniref:Peptide ABC transporter substrate-binding protein n=1 Tax=Sporolactobacillus laevolacticus DSM 442 TaxID=1395513 RepID=V6IZ44_9BACL|nr:ATP-binding cassette domain-containing protein [Sporolactobacillus laevolacticus]EST12705.1 peptide ABC transporter substrate-binding protein [Sporolactobacillus laevolacticus DSM 442]
MSEDKRKLLEVLHLKKYFNQGSRQEVRAVDDVSFDIYEGETFGLVGESGCGKSTTGRTIIQLYEATGGEVLFNGQNIFKIKKSAGRNKLRQEIQMIFQDPFASLDPHLTVKDIIAEGMDVHHLSGTSKERENRVYELLEEVGLNREHAGRYPHEFSGGQRQRIGIARALAVDPKLIIADEPISALDVSIQAQVVNLLKKIQRQQGLTYLFIAHDLSMVKYISDRIGVMHQGMIVELADSEELYRTPLHPYTESLLSAIPQPDPISERKRQRLEYQSKKGNGQMKKLREIAPRHFVYCAEHEVTEYQQKYKTIQNEKEESRDEIN